MQFSDLTDAFYADLEAGMFDRMLTIFRRNPRWPANLAIVRGALAALGDAEIVAAFDSSLAERGIVLSS